MDNASSDGWKVLVARNPVCEVLLVRAMRRRGWVEFHEDSCTGCGLCIAICPVGCLELSLAVNRHGYRPARYRGSGCRADGACFRACPEPDAITVHRAMEPAREVA